MGDLLVVPYKELQDKLEKDRKQKARKKRAKAKSFDSAVSRDSGEAAKTS